MDRTTAYETVCEFVKDEGLRRHMRCVEVAMRWYAAKLEQDPDDWGLVGLLHDYDWEIHPTIEAHPKEGASLLLERGIDPDLSRTILSHNTEGTGVEREKDIDFALLACDEITGLIVACVLVRPSKDIRDMAIKSVKKKWKDRAFAAGVPRDHVEAATKDFSDACFGGGLELWDHISNVLDAMKEQAESLELDGRLAS